MASDVAQVAEYETVHRDLTSQRVSTALPWQLGDVERDVYRALGRLPR